jgi:hypothetical protein
VFSLIGATGQQGVQGPQGPAGAVTYTVKSLGTGETAYTVLDSDSSTTVVVTTMDNSVITLPANLLVPIQVSFIKRSPSDKTMTFNVSAPGTRYSKNDASIVSVQYGAVTAIHTANGDWYIAGDLE